jgi:predicted nucleic acid-binding protein
VPTALDTNILCYSLDNAYPENTRARKLLSSLSSQKTLAVNPTIIHETYHTLVYGQKWIPQIAKERIQLILAHPYVEFYNQTKRTTSVALNLAVKYTLGGRDSLILASCLVNKITKLLTHDADLLNLKKISWRGRTLLFDDPVAK